MERQYVNSLVQRVISLFSKARQFIGEYTNLWAGRCMTEKTARERESSLNLYKLTPQSNKKIVIG